MPQLPLVAFAHMSGHLIRQFGQDPFSKWSVSLTVNLELRTTRDTQLWGLDRAFEKTACSKNGQDGTRLQAHSIAEGYKGLCPCFPAGFATPGRTAKTKRAAGPAELWHKEGKAVPHLPWLPSPREAPLLGRRKGEPTLLSSWAPKSKGPSGTRWQKQLKPQSGLG